MAKTNDVSELNELIGLKAEHVKPYLYALGFEYFECNYKYRKIFNDYKRNRCLVVDLFEDKSQRIEQFKLITNRLYTRWNERPAKAIYTTSYLSLCA